MNSISLTQICRKLVVTALATSLGSCLGSGIGICLFTPVAHAAAGGISGGGGGVTNPKSASQQAVANAVDEYGRLVLLSWFQAQEFKFSILPSGIEADQLAQKLFRGPRSIYNVLQTTGVEFHDRTPCKDANGEAKDASIYSQTPDRICMSLFSMAPKLNERNVNAETLALLAHEMSHLSGTTEDEAVALQEAMLRDLDQVSLGDFVSAKSDVSSDLSRLLQVLITATNEAKQNRFGEAFFQAQTLIFDVQSKYMFKKKPFLMLRPDELAMATTSLARIGVVRAYYGILPSNPDARFRSFYVSQLNDSFGDQPRASAFQILTTGFHNRLPFSPVYEQVLIERPVDGITAAAELAGCSMQAEIAYASLPYLNDKSFPSIHTD